MKKIICSFLICGLILSISGCGEDEIPTSKEIEDQQGTITMMEEPTLTSEEDAESSRQIGQDWDADIAAGLLWIDEQGRVVDKDGNLIDAYDYIMAADNMINLTSDGDMVEGYIIADNGQIVVDEEYINRVEESDSEDDNILYHVYPTYEEPETEPEYTLAMIDELYQDPKILSGEYIEVYGFPVCEAKSNDAGKYILVAGNKLGDEYTYITVFINNDLDINTDDVLNAATISVKGYWNESLGDPEYSFYLYADSVDIIE